MKASALVIALIALLGMLIFTNPSMDDFSDYVRQKIVKETQKDVQDPLGQFLGSIMGGIAGGLAGTQTVRSDYVLFSIYELKVGKERLKALGVLKNFVLLEEPDLDRYKPDKSSERRDSDRL
jgi:hypothetical protein